MCEEWKGNESVYKCNSHILCNTILVICNLDIHNAKIKQWLKCSHPLRPVIHYLSILKSFKNLFLCFGELHLKVSRWLHYWNTLEVSYFICLPHFALSINRLRSDLFPLSRKEFLGNLIVEFCTIDWFDISFALKLLNSSIIKLNFNVVKHD